MAAREGTASGRSPVADQRPLRGATESRARSSLWSARGGSARRGVGSPCSDIFLPCSPGVELLDFTKVGRVPTPTTLSAGDDGHIMRTPLDPRQRPVSLTVASPTEPAAEPSRIPHVPWLLAAVAWTAAVAALGWAAVGALVSVSWLTAVHIPASEIFGIIGQGWLAVHGVTVGFGGATIRLMPLGITLVIMAGCAFAAHHAAGQFELADEASPREGALAWTSVTGSCVGTYVLAGGVIAAVTGGPGQMGEAVPALLAVPFIGAGVGALVGLHLDPLAAMPVWVRCLPGALGVGVAALTLGSILALGVALVAHRDRVVTLHDALEPDAVGAVVLTLTQLAFLPNLIGWAGAFVLGAGVTLGADGLVSPTIADPGVLPAIPVLGAVPTAPGVADWAWLAVGLVAGAASAWWVLRGTGTTWLFGLWQGALAGLIPGIVWVTASWFTVGDLGVQHLSGFGPRFPDLLVWGTAPLALAGAVCGVCCGLWQTRRAVAAPVEEPSAIG